MGKSLLTGKRFVQRLAQPKAERQSVDGLADNLVDRLIDHAETKAYEQARKELQPLIDVAIKRAETAEEQLKIAQSSSQSAAKNHATVAQAVSQLQAQIKALQAEIALSKEEGVEPAEIKEIAEIKAAISGLGQLIKSQKPTIVQSSPIRIPDFDIAPVRDGVGNLIGATVKPIGGN